MVTRSALRRFTVDDYTRMWRAGILTEDERVELIGGEIREMSPIGPVHAAIVKRLNALLSQRLVGAAIISVQDPIQLDDLSQPQPDLAILQWRSDYYADAHPVAEDVLLVIEVADTTTEFDRNEKLPRYAAVGVAEIWLVNVADRCIEQYTQPRNGAYQIRQLRRQGDTLEAAVLPGLALPVEQVFA